MSKDEMSIESLEGDQVIEMDINRLRDFKNHPFKVTADISMVELKESIQKFGILNPLIVRPVIEGYYEMILSILVDTFISKISLPMQPVPEIGSISGA